MLGSITPLGERGRGRRWGVTVSAYALGSAGGGAIAGGAAGAVGAALSAVAPAGPSVLWVAAAAVLAGAAVDGALAAHLAPSSVLPGPRRQVNEDWLGRYRGWVTGVGFGFQLGLGVATIVTTAAVYSLLLVAVLSGSPLTGAVIGATFGLARAVPVLAVGRVRSPDAVLLVDARLRRWQPASARLAAIAQVAAAALLISAAAAR
jgi:sulfite exporter TauE/SafE